MTEEKKLYEFTEINDHEGEEWTVFVYLTQAEREAIVGIIESEGDFDDESAYSMEPSDLTEAEARKLCKRKGRGYYPPYQFAKGVDLESEDGLYKLGIFEF